MCQQHIQIITVKMVIHCTEHKMYEMVSVVAAAAFITTTTTTVLLSLGKKWTQNAGKLILHPVLLGQPNNGCTNGVNEDCKEYGC